MSRKKHLDDPPEVDAISSPSMISSYYKKYTDYKNALANYKYAVKQRDKAWDEEGDLRKAAWDKTVKELGNNVDILGKQFNRVYNSYPGLNEAIIKKEDANYNYNKKQEDYNKALRTLGQATIDKYRNTHYDILNATNWGGEDYLASLGPRESRGAKEVADYFNSYVNSKGINRIIKNQRSLVPWIKNPDYTLSARRLKKSIKDSPMNTNGVFDVNTYAAGGERIYIGSDASKTGKSINVIINADPLYEDKEYPYWFIVPHEMMHRYNNTVWGSTVYGGQEDALNKNQNTAPGHDSWNYEKHSDLEALRFMLYKYGIYDSRGEKDATPEDIEKLRKLYPKLRPLKQMDNEKAAWMINHVAQNNTDKRRHLYNTYYA